MRTSIIEIDGVRSSLAARGIAIAIAAVSP